jgi:hypothetical protein
MTRTLLSLLAVLLAIQIGITTLVYWPREATTEAQGSLLGELAATAIDRVTIAGEGERSVSLQRREYGWVLEPDALPADGARMRTLLQALAGPTGYPVATTASAQQRFDVAADGFQRRITLEHAGGSTIVYLGSAPGFRKVHARAEGGDAVYSIDFNSFDAPATAEGWLDRTLAQVRSPQRIEWLLDLPAEPATGTAPEEAGDSASAAADSGERATVADAPSTAAAADPQAARLPVSAGTRIEGALLRNEDSWVLDDGSAADAQAAETLVNALANLRVTGIGGQAPGREELSLRLSGDAVPETLVLLRASAEEDSPATRYLLRIAGYETLFTLSSYDRDRLVEAIEALAAPAADPDAAEQ